MKTKNFLAIFFILFFISVVKGYCPGDKFQIEFSITPNETITSSDNVKVFMVQGIFKGLIMKYSNYYELEKVVAGSKVSTKVNYDIPTTATPGTYIVVGSVSVLEKNPQTGSLDSRTIGSYFSEFTISSCEYAATTSTTLPQISTSTTLIPISLGSFNLDEKVLIFALIFMIVFLSLTYIFLKGKR